MVSSNGSKIQPVLHIGMPKAASTSLQSHLFSKHSQVGYLGSYKFLADPNRPGRDLNWKKWVSPAMYELHQQLAERQPHKANIETCRRVYSEDVLPTLGEGLVPVWSWESMMLNRTKIRRARAQNIKAVLGDCRVVAVIRQPLKLVESAYFQFLKRNNIGRDHHFKQPVYLTIEEWLQKIFGEAKGEPPSHLDYSFTIRTFAEFFGKDSVRVLLMEDLIRDPDQFIRDVCDHAGIDADEGVRLTAAKRENSRWTVEQIERLQQLRNGSFLTALRYRFMRPSKRRELLGLPEERVGRPKSAAAAARAVISEHWQKQINDVTREGNQWLAKTYNLPLESLGYPM